MKEKLEDIVELIKDYPKTSLTIAGVLLSCILFSSWWIVYRSASWFDCAWVQEYKLERDLTFKHLTGSCMANNGTEDNPKLIPIERLIGTVDGEEGL